MPNQNLARGVFLAGIAIFFAYNAFKLSIGDLARAGPGLFPLLVSSLLLTLAVAMMIQSRLVPALPMHLNLRNIAVIVSSLAVFVIASTFVDMAVGITAMVFVAGFAAATYSWKRNLTVSLGLILVALAFEKLLGLNLRLI